MVSLFDGRRFGLWAARGAAALSIVVLVCVPALTRAGQKLETASHTPSFSKNVDCPPKKVTAARVLSVALTVTFTPLDTVAVARPVLPRADVLPRSPHFGPPLPLRAPPSLLLA